MNDPTIEGLRRRLGITDDDGPRRAGVVPQRMTLDNFQDQASAHEEHLRQLVELEKKQKNEPLRELMRRLGRA